jgi:hypothetical protein
MSITQLNPPLPLQTPKGQGLAHFVIDYGMEEHLYWTVFLETGEIWTFANPFVRACVNFTFERPNPSQPPSDAEFMGRKPN